MAKQSSRADRIKAAAAMAYGQRGLTKMADAAGVSKQLMSFIVAGGREVTDEVYRKVAKALLARADFMRSRADSLDHIAGRIIRELEQEK